MSKPQPSLLLLRVEHVGERLSLSRARVYELIASGSIPSVTIGRSRRVRADVLEAWIEGGCAVADAQVAEAPADRVVSPRSKHPGAR